MEVALAVFLMFGASPQNPQNAASCTHATSSGMQISCWPQSKETFQLTLVADGKGGDKKEHEILCRSSATSEFAAPQLAVLAASRWPLELLVLTAECCFSTGASLLAGVFLPAAKLVLVTAYST